MKRQIIVLLSITLFSGYACASDSMSRCEEKEISANYGEAVKCYEKIYNENKMNIGLAFKIATLYENKIENDEKALSIITDALKYHPTNLQLNLFLMNYYFKRDNKDIGMVFYKKASYLRKENEIYTIPSLPLYKIKKKIREDEYIEFMMELLQFNPSDVVARGELARIYISGKEYSKAEAELMNILKYDNSDGEVYFNLGLTYYLLSRYEKALDNFNQAKKLGYDFREEYIEAAKKQLQK